MNSIPSGVRVWVATGHTNMRRGMQSLALAVQESLKRDPTAGDLYIFRSRRDDLVKILWHDGLGMSLYAKRPDQAKFIWPSGVSISAAQMASMLEGNRLAESAAKTRLGPRTSQFLENSTIKSLKLRTNSKILPCLSFAISVRSDAP